MKKHLFLKILAGIVILIVVVVFAVIMYIMNFLPNIKVPDIKVEITKERIEHGKYLAFHVTACMDCHSTRDWTKFTGPMIPGTEGKGGEKFDKTMGFPGIFYSSNLTPYNLSKWSDGEIFRAITCGVGKGDRPLFPVMPYLIFILFSFNTRIYFF